MSSPAQDEYRKELAEARRLVMRRLTGWRYFALLPQETPTNPIVSARITYYEQGLAAIDATMAGMDLLDAWGYPTMPAVQVTHEIYEDLTSDHDAQSAALEEVVTVKVAAHFFPTFGAPAPKDLGSET